MINSKIISKTISEEWLTSITNSEGRPYINIYGERNSEKVVYAKLQKDVSHSKIEVIGPTHYYIISGDLIINELDFNKGAYIRIEAGEQFIPKTKNGCTVLCIYTQGYKFLE